MNSIESWTNQLERFFGYFSFKVDLLLNHTGKWKWTPKLIVFGCDTYFKQSCISKNHTWFFFFSKRESKKDTLKIWVTGCMIKKFNKSD